MLRTASILALIQYIAHTYFFLSAAHTHDMAFGYGLMVIVSGFVGAVLLWQLASLAKTEPRRIRPIIALLILANIIHALLAWVYFRIIPPVAFDIFVAVFLGLAFHASSRKVA